MNSFLDAHLNISWLRPESALCDAAASEIIARFSFRPPVLDLGSGNGLFSFITAGGEFTEEYDWYRNANPRGFWKNSDIYNSFHGGPRQGWIRRRPLYRIDCAVDAKANLLKQAGSLGFYRRLVKADARWPLPFDDGSFETVFSNILYWLPDREHGFREIYRLLRPGGRALLCLQDPRFYSSCESYDWKNRRSPLLRLLNRGRSETLCWTMTQGELRSLSRQIGFRWVHHQYYLSPLTLRVWDIGARPVSRSLIRLVQTLSPAARRAFKRDWLNDVKPLLKELFRLEKSLQGEGGFHFVCLEKPIHRETGKSKRSFK